MAGPSTTAVHGGETPDASHGAVNAPIVQSTTYRYPERADGTPAPYIYSRYTNPTLEALEAKTAALEGASGSLAFASGLGAVSSVCAALLRPGDTIAVQAGVYGGTTALLQNQVAPMGVRVVTVPTDDPSNGPDGGLPDGTRLLWCESITNPLLRVTDLDAWAEAAHDVGALLSVDATFASPVLQRPLEHGADLVVHSATKYLGGHSDVTAGVVSFQDQGLHHRIWTARRDLGAVLDPHAAYLVLRGMKTLALRMDRHCSNAAALAAVAAGHPAVQAVHHPGRPDHPDRAVADRLLPCGHGGMLTLDLGSLPAAQAFRRAVRTIVPAASLGGVESLVSLPLETSHAYADPATRRAQGITDGLVRLSVGIEDLEDLQEDLLRGLDAAADAQS